MRNQEWYAALAQLHPLDLCQLIFRLFGGDAMDCETALGIVDKTEVLAGFLDRDNVHETGGIGGVGADLAVYFYEALHDDSLGFAGIESIFQSGRSQQRLFHLDEGLRSHLLRMKTISGMQSRSL